MAVCLKNSATHTLVFLLRKNYLVINFELKCSVRIGILFLFVMVFLGDYLGQGLGFFLFCWVGLFVCFNVASRV